MQRHGMKDGGTVQAPSALVNTLTQLHKSPYMLLTMTGENTEHHLWQLTNVRFTSKKKRQMQPTVTYTCLVVEFTSRTPQTNKELAERRKKCFLSRHRRSIEFHLYFCSADFSRQFSGVSRSAYVYILYTYADKIIIYMRLRIHGFGIVLVVRTIPAYITPLKCLPEFVLI